MSARRGYDVYSLDRRLIEKAMARLDAKKQRERRAKWAAARKLRYKRAKERKLAKQAELRATSILRRRGGQPELTRRLPIAGWKAMAARLEPDTWYSFSDMRVLNPEFSKDSLKAWIQQRLRAQNLVERAGNPDFDDSIPAGSQVACRYLYRLTAEGERLAAEWRRELGE